MPRQNTIPRRMAALLEGSDRKWTRREIADALGIGYMSVHSAIVSMRTSRRPEYRELVETRIKRAPNTGGKGKPRSPKPASKIAKKTEPPIAAPDYRPACVPAPKLKLDLAAAFRAMERKPEPDWFWDWRRQRPPTSTGAGRAGDVP